MTNQIRALEVEYRKCAEVIGKASVLGDAKTINWNYDKLAVIGAKLKAYGEQGQAILHRLMKDSSDAVASLAAIDSLFFAEAEGLEVLDSIAEKHGPIAFNARITARQWRAGELKAQMDSQRNSPIK